MGMIYWSVVAQAAKPLRNVAYDNKHPSQKLDVYRVDSAKPAPVMVHFHGGGWRGGSKAHVPA